MSLDTVLDLIQALVAAPRTTEQVARTTGVSLNAAQRLIAGLHKRGWVYVVEDIPPNA